MRAARVQTRDQRRDEFYRAAKAIAPVLAAVSGDTREALIARIRDYGSPVLRDAARDAIDYGLRMELIEARKRQAANRRKEGRL